MSGLLKLAERVEALEGPDREVDALIYRALAGLPTEHWFTAHDGSYVTNDRVPHVTASLDAAMTLIPPGDRKWELTTEASASDPRFGPYQARIHIDEVSDDPDDTGPQGIANGATPALALCAAALRTQGSQQG